MEEMSRSLTFVTLLIGGALLLGRPECVCAQAPTPPPYQAPLRPVQPAPAASEPAAFIQLPAATGSAASIQLPPAGAPLVQVQAVAPGNAEAPGLPAPQPASISAMPMLTAPAAESGETTLPINLPAALRLSNARAWDITIATQQLGVATAQLQAAKVLWLPNVIAGAAYAHHDGPIQANDGTLSNSTRSSLFAGAAPLAVLQTSDAIYAPLAQRQIRRAQEANVQTATNDTLTQVAVVYFDALEARADLACLDDVAQRAAAMVRKTESLVPGLVPDVELARVRTFQANIAVARQGARRRWRVASAEVARVLRLSATTLIEPIEPPQLQVTLVPPAANADDLIGIALQSRPELTYNEAQVAAAEQRLRQEEMRPFLPIVVVRGGTTPTPYPLGFGAYGGGSNGSIGDFGVRSDWDLEAIWEIRNLGFGTRAIIRERKNSLAVVRSQECRYRDLVAKEVTQTWANLRAADGRTAPAEQELRQALISASKSLEGLGEVKRAGGNLMIPVIRPLEVVAALQALSQAYYNYYGAIADYNRSQFQIYRTLGSPAQLLEGHDGLCGPSLSAAAPVPSTTP